MRPWPRSSTPSPYEILDVEPGKPYSKDNFHRLVKLYHPDMHDAGPEMGAIPRAVRVERYRLIVAANNLLSDPRKRQLYEAYSLGWVFDNRRRHAADFHPRPGTHHTAPAGGGEPWAGTAPPGGGGGLRQRPIYTSNAAFAILLVALAMAGAVLQVKRLRAAAERHKRLEVLLHETIEEELRAWAGILGGESRDDRILAFLARRHGVPRQLERWASTCSRA